MPTFKNKGMSCQHCAASVTKALNEIEGIKEVRVDLEKGKARFQQSTPVEPEAIKKAIAAIGFEVIS